MFLETNRLIPLRQQQNDSYQSYNVENESGGKRGHCPGDDRNFICTVTFTTRDEYHTMGSVSKATLGLFLFLEGWREPDPTLPTQEGLCAPIIRC